MTNKEAIAIILGRESCFCLHGAYKDCNSQCDIRDALDLAIKALENRPTCMTCKYKGCYVTEKPCKECSHAWVDKYEEAENEDN